MKIRKMGVRSWGGGYQSAKNRIILVTRPNVSETEVGNVCHEGKGRTPAGRIKWEKRIVQRWRGIKVRKRRRTRRLWWVTDRGVSNNPV